MMNSESRDGLGNKAQFFVLMTSLLFAPQSLTTLPRWIVENGGYVAVIPYTVSSIILAVPLVFLELSLGQFMQRTGTRMWAVAPLFKGLGISVMLTSLVRSSVNTVMASWAGYYIYLASTNQMPSCNATTTITVSRDIVSFHQSKPLGDLFNLTSMSFGMQPSLFNTTDDDDDDDDDGIDGFSSIKECSAAFDHFWRHDVLQATPSLTSPGHSVLHLLIGCVAMVFVCLLIVVFGIGAMGKIVTALMPAWIAAVVALLVQMCVRDSQVVASNLSHLLGPDFGLLIKPEVWFNSCHLVLLTHHLSTGVLPALSSYLRWNNNTFRDTLMVCLLSTLLNGMGVVTVFSIAGSVLEMSESFPTFTSVPLALSPHPTIWTIIYYVLVILVIVTTNALYWGAAVLTFTDMSRKLFKWRVLIVLGVSAFVLLLTIPMTLQIGVYVYWVIEFVCFGPFIIGVISLLHCLVLAFVYGGHRFYDNIETMTGDRPTWWMRFCWAWLAPLVIMTCLGYHGYKLYHNPLSLGDTSAPYHTLAAMMVVILTCTVLVPIPLTGVWVLCSGPAGCMAKFRWSTQPRLHPYQIPIRWRLDRKWHKFSPL